MVTMAPRYDPRILELARALDDRRETIAEICRRVAFAAERAGLTRPSYVHIRRFILDERRRRDEIRELLEETTRVLLGGRIPDVPETIIRLNEASLPRR